MNDKDIKELLEEIDESEDIVTLLDDEGNEVDFLELAIIELDGKRYSILQPVELLEGMEEDEALVFRLEDSGDDEETFEMELDDDILDAVFAEYNRLIEEEDAADEE